VAREYKDKEKDRVSSDSPVASSSAQRLALALLAEKQWIPNSWDFTTCYALLRMRPLSISCVECSVVNSCGKVDYDKSG
jgi:hypothetical protein